MPEERANVKPVASAAIDAAGPEVFARWRATALGAATEGLELRCILALVGSIDGQRVLDLGCGDGVLVTTLARQRARAVGIDVDHAALQVASSRTDVTGVGGVRFVEGRIERLPFPDGTFDVVTAVTVLCLVSDRSAACERPRASCGLEDVSSLETWDGGWLGSRLWRSAHFWTAADLSRLIEQAGFSVEVIRGSVYYPPIGILARALAPLDRWLGSVTTIGAAFIAVAATKRAHVVTTRTAYLRTRSGRLREADSAP